MKGTTLFSLFLLCAFTSYLASASNLVVDTDGDLLRNGGIFYLRPVIITGNGGGVEFDATGNETCPLSVVQNPSSFSNGLPVQMSSPVRISSIYEGLDLDIEFADVPPCATSSEWTAVRGVGDGLSLKLTGYDDTVPGAFRIKSVTNDIGGYNILFCPLHSPCGYVGTELDANRKRRLFVSQREESALWIRFQKLSFILPATASASASA